ncbi:hypothetical protein EN817_23305 [Mesorhizobium sp. M3A.F.Ca.ET.174.01.1.1]|uniref:hypothetical protein n=1 Tax=unclassified Mesorhizobium TaxID=325217 RepID=UPI001093E79C|nr:MULTISPECIES: hypothetical protein [unclassified Mesorhizobium]TGS85044.1 hypothetical protein EN818_21390 [Mesorhizobium sp. M3A.F.Ca.ET.175.01.1.1]TGT23032.1 hypothetical protein EN817_23305 [Mesorhizobium sp. M3A.F.Ca.ET.174.01.1.1]
MRDSTILGDVVPGFGELVGCLNLLSGRSGVRLRTQAPNAWGSLCAVRCNQRRHIGFEKLSAAAGELRLRSIESHDWVQRLGEVGAISTFKCSATAGLLSKEKLLAGDIMLGFSNDGDGDSGIVGDE